MTPIRVHLTADDYGLHPAVNRGIEELARTGCITAVSVMVHDGAALQTADRLADAGVACGLHLVFVEEKPLSGPDGLAGLLDRQGRLPSDYRALTARLAPAPWRARRLLGEARAQVRRYREFGLPLDFINSHQHVHLLPPVWLALRPLLEELPGVAVRASHRAAIPANADGAVALSSRISLALSRPGGRPCHEPRGISAAGRMTANRLRDILAGIAAAPARPGITAEVVLHPGDQDADLERRYAHWSYTWGAEKAAVQRIATEGTLERLGLVAASPPGRPARPKGSASA